MHRLQVLGEFRGSMSAQLSDAHARADQVDDHAALVDGDYLTSEVAGREGLGEL
jgi:hypothetical protein